MASFSRKSLFLTVSAIAVLTLSPTLRHAVPPFALLDLSADAMAKDGHSGEHSGGHDNGGHDDGGNDNDGGGSDDGGSSHSGHDDSSGSHDSSDDDGNDDSNGSSDDDSSGDDSATRGRGTDDSATEAEKRADGRKAGHRHGRHADDGVEVSISAEGLAGLANGSLRAVDALGRSLEIEVETEHGKQVVTAKLAHDADASAGPITAVNIVPKG